MAVIDAIRLTSEDNVATAIRPLAPGQTVNVGATGIVVIDKIPQWHKFAICNIKSGQKVFKFGMPIGVAKQQICVGEHVGSHNLETTQEIKESEDCNCEG